MDPLLSQFDPCLLPLDTITIVTAEDLLALSVEARYHAEQAGTLDQQHSRLRRTSAKCDAAHDIPDHMRRLSVPALASYLPSSTFWPETDLALSKVKHQTGSNFQDLGNSMHELAMESGFLSNIHPSGFLPVELPFNWSSNCGGSKFDSDFVSSLLAGTVPTANEITESAIQSSETPLPQLLNAKLDPESMRSILPRSTLVSPSPTAIPLLLDAKLRNKCHSNILQRFFNPMTEEGMNLVNEFHPDCRRQKAAVQGRFRPSDRELTLLNAIFEVNYFPSLSIRRKLAAKFCVDPRQVQFWYQNKRAHVRAAGTILRRANDL